jgi:hypothetical protein
VDDKPIAERPPKHLSISPCLISFIDLKDNVNDIFRGDLVLSPYENQ